MDKLRLINDSVIQLTDKTAILEFKGKFAYYEKGGGTPDYRYTSMSRLTTKLFELVDEENKMVVGTDGKVHYIGDVTITGKQCLAECIANALDTEQVKKLTSDYNWKQDIKITASNSGGFRFVRITIGWDSFDILYTKDGNTKLRSFMDGLQGISTDNTNKQYAAVYNLPNKEGGYRESFLIDTEGKNVIGPASHISLVDKERHIYHVAEGGYNRIVAVDKSEQVTTIRPEICDKSDICYIANGLVCMHSKSGRGSGNRRYSIAMENCDIANMQGKIFFEDVTFINIQNSNIALICDTNKFGNSIGLLLKNKMSIQQINDVMQLELCYKTEALKVIHTDGRVSFINDNGVSDKVEEWSIQDKLVNNWLKLDVYASMDDKLQWYITNRQGEILIKDVFESFNAAQEWYGTIVNREPFKKVMKSTFVWKNPRFDKCNHL